jgi:aspartate racemase
VPRKRSKCPGKRKVAAALTRTGALFKKGALYRQMKEFPVKTIGICAHSAEGGSLCFLECVHEGERLLGPHAHPEIVLSCVALSHSMPFWGKDDYPGVRKFLADGIKVTADGGADFFIVPDNTAHVALESAGEALALPGLHIAAVVCGEAAARGYKKVGLLGTRWTMEGPVYRQQFAKHGLTRVIPPADQRAFINASIFDELCQGVFKPETTARYAAVIEGLKREGCDAVALCCTEIPIIITQKNSALPILDSTRLLARAAVSVALGKAPMPAWRGGPPSA